MPAAYTFIDIDVNMPKMGRLAHAEMFMYATSHDSRVLEQTQSLGASGFITKLVKYRAASRSTLAATIPEKHKQAPQCLCAAGLGVP